MDLTKVNVNVWMYKKDRFQFGFNDQPMMIESWVARGWQYIFSVPVLGEAKRDKIHSQSKSDMPSDQHWSVHSIRHSNCSLLLKLLFNYKFYEHILWEINCRGKEILHLWALNVFCIYILQCFANFINICLIQMM